jgi:hypothetical protein
MSEFWPDRPVEELAAAHNAITAAGGTLTVTVQVSTQGRGRCSRCGQDRALRRDGMLRAHRLPLAADEWERRYCEGEGHPPAPASSAGATAAAADALERAACADEHTRLSEELDALGRCTQPEEQTTDGG